MKNWIFLLACIAISAWMVIDSGNADQTLSMFQDISLPNSSDLMKYAAQGFYYLALLLGVVYLARKIKKQRQKTKHD